MRSPLVIIGLVVFLVSSTEAQDRVCRSGVNTTIFGFPLRLWSEFDKCSGSSSCFLGEIGFDVNFQEENLTLTYGSCISTAYKDLLECDQLFPVSAPPNAQILNSFLGDATNIIDQGIKLFAEDTARTIEKFLQNKNGELDNMRLVEEVVNNILSTTNQSLPQNTVAVINKLDTLILTALLNVSQVEKAIKDFLDSFSILNTENEMTSALISQLLENSNISAPSEFNHLIENLPGFILQYIQNEYFYDAFNQSLFYAVSSISGFDSSNTTTAASSLMRLIRTIIPGLVEADADTSRVFDTISQMVMQIIEGKDGLELDIWESNLLKEYSNTTVTSQNFSASIINFVTSVAPHTQLSEGWITLINYFPGYLYMFSEDHVELDKAFRTVSNILNMYQDSISNVTPDVNALGTNMTFADIQDYIKFVISATSSDGNQTSAQLEELLDVINGSFASNGSVAFGNAIREILSQFNTTIPSHYLESIENIPNIIRYLQQLGSLNDAGLLVFISKLDSGELTLNGTFVYLSSIIPDYYNLEKLIMSMPELINQLMNGNLGYINQWQINLLISYSRITDATTTFSNAVLQYLTNFGIHEQITDDIKIMIQYYPGYLYNFVPPEMIAHLETALYNISDVLTSNNVGSPISLGSLLESYSLNTSDPAFNGIISFFDNFLNLNSTQNVTELTLEALTALQQFTMVTNETSPIVNSLQDILSSLNITIPNEYEGVLNLTSGELQWLFPDHVYLDTVFGNISAYINSLNSSNPNFDAIFQTLSAMIPPEYNLDKLLRSLSPLLSQLVVGNVQYVTEWQITILAEYSNVTSAAESVSNATLVLLQRFGLYEALPSDMISLIKYYPGYLYNFVPADSIPQFEMALYQVAYNLGNIQQTSQIDIASILESFSLNVSDPALQSMVTVLQGLVDASSSGNVTEIGLQALESLKSISIITNGTAAFTESFVNFLSTFNVTVPQGYDDIIGNVLGLFSTMFPEYEATISSVLANSTSIFQDIRENNYENIFASIGVMMPAEYNLRIMVDSIPSLLNHLTAGNFTYINTWQLELIEKYSIVTPATEAVSNSTFALVRRFGLDSAITPDLQILITYIPGYLYNFFPANLLDLERALYNISNILDLADPTTNISTSDILQLYGMNTSDPSINTIISAMDSIINIANARNVSELAREALLSLGSVATVTNETQILSNSFVRLLQQFNVTVPDTYTEVMENTGSLLAAILPQQNALLATIFSNLTRVLETSGDSISIYEIAIELAKSVTPVEYNLHAFLDSLTPLLSELTQGNFQYINQWQLNVLSSYSTASDATNAFLNSTVEFLSRIGVYDLIPLELKSVIDIYPGYINSFVPPDMVPQFESLLYNISLILQSSESGEPIDIQGIIDSSSLNTSDPMIQKALTVIISLTNLSRATNLTELGIEALQSLQTISVVTDEIRQISGGILAIVNQFNVSVPAEQQIVMEHSLALLYQLFPEQKDLISNILLNISSGFMSFNSTSADFSSIAMLSQFIPAEYNLRPLIESLPSLLEQLVNGNYEYINVWQISLLQSYSRNSNATEMLSASILQLFERYGLSGLLNPETESFIKIYPGYLYNFVPADMVPQLDLAFVTIAGALNFTDSAAVDILEILDSFSINISDVTLRTSISQLSSVLNIAQARNLTQFATEALASLTTLSTITPQAVNFTDSIVRFLETVNVTIAPEYQDMIRSVPGLLYTILPENAIISTVLANVSQALDNFNMTNPDFQSITLLLQQVIPSEYNLGTLVNSLPTLLQALLDGNFEYVNVWQVNLLVSYSQITPSTAAFANATIDILQRWNVYEMLPAEVKSLIAYYPGYIYNFLPPSLTSDYDSALQNISQILHLTNPDANVTLQELFQSFSFNTTTPGLEEIVTLLSSISNLATAGNLSEFGIEAIRSLSNTAKVTEATIQLNSAVATFLQELNVTLSDEYQQIVSSAPGLLLAMLPEYEAELTAVFVNISSNLNQAGSANSNLTVIFSDLMQLVPESYNLNILLGSMPELLNQIMAGNYNYINTWQLDVLIAYSKVTPATEAVSNSTINLIERLGLNVSIPEEIYSFIKYYPGYFYNFVGTNSTIWDGVLYTLSASIDSISTTQEVDFASLLESIDTVPEIPTELRNLVSGFDNLLRALVTNNQSAIDDWGNRAYQEYCSSGRNLTMAFAQVMTSELEKWTPNSPEYVTHLFQCVPEMLYTFMPNQTETLDTALRLAVLANTDLSAYIRLLTKDSGFSFSSDLDPIINAFPDIQTALLQGNITELSAALAHLQSLMQDTKLSNLTLQIIQKIGVNVTDETRAVIEQITGNAVFTSLSQIEPSIDIFLSSVLDHLHAENDVGVALRNAFASINLTISDRYTALLNNMQTLVSGILNNEMDVIAQTVLDILVEYNASYPSYQVQFAISQYKLQLALQQMVSTDLPEEVFVHLGDMYRLLLKMNNVSENFLKNAILGVYPEASAVVDVLFQLEAEDSFRFIYNTTLWIFSEERNITVLTEYLVTIIKDIFDKQNLQMADLLTSLTQPIASSCKYKTCDADRCNTYELLYPEITTTTAPTTASDTTTTTQQSTESFTTSFTSPKSTASITSPSILDSTSTDGENTAAADQTTPDPDSTTDLMTEEMTGTGTFASESTGTSTAATVTTTSVSSTTTTVATTATTSESTTTSTATSVSSSTNSATTQTESTSSTAAITTQTPTTTSGGCRSNSLTKFDLILFGIAISLKYIFL